MVPAEHADGIVMPFAGKGHGPTDGRNRGAAGVEQRDVPLESLGEPAECGLLIRGGRRGGRQDILHQPAQGDAGLFCRVAGEMPERCGCDHEQE